MRISVITPSIRPDGLKAAFETLSAQTLRDFEWLPRLSIPGERSDLCYQTNRALDEAGGELIVFLQDYISVRPDALELAWQAYQSDKGACWTFPVGKVADFRDDPEWDWRHFWEKDEVPYDRWEIDFGSVPAAVLGAERFFERYDEGFGWENVDLACRLSLGGARFRVMRENAAVAIDHDKIMSHPYKGRPNASLWAKRKAILEHVPGDDGD